MRMFLNFVNIESGQIEEEGNMKVVIIICIRVHVRLHIQKAIIASSISR
jgi:hypothetical protein